MEWYDNDIAVTALAPIIQRKIWVCCNLARNNPHALILTNGLDVGDSIKIGMNFLGSNCVLFV